MKGLRLVILAVVFVGLSATFPVMAKPPGGEGAKASDRMERHTGGVGERDLSANDKKSKKEKLRKDEKKEHADEFLVDGHERDGKNKGEREKNRDHSENDESPGLYKQHDMKMDQEQKELGRGSEQGQKMREQHSRKWWKFWE